MEGGAKKVLESITFETLHAHNFTRSSSQATLVLTDLLSRYLTLLSAGCAKYAEHAGRLKLTVRDAVSALDELGVGVDELNEYCASEARDISRYAVHTARRIEDLNEFKASLEVGLKEDRDDLIPLVYAPMPSSTPSDEDEASSESDEETVGGTEREEDTAIAIGMDKIIREDEAGMSRRDYITSLLPPSSPPLPPSPISNPSTPPRKRARTSSWNPPPHIPDFLPPFPTDSPRHSPSLPPQNTSIPINHVKLERPPSPPPPQLSTSSSSADYLTPTPYSLSTLASTPSWHLPSAPAISPESADRAPPRSAGPPVQPALIGAYHHVLTHPPPPNVTSVNPARYKVALAFLAQSEVHPRWEPAATLFSNTAPNPPRVASMGPTYAMPVDKFPPTPTEGKAGKEQDLDKDKKSNLPSVPPKPIATSERITPLTSQQASRIPNLARQVLPGSVYTRTTRLTHPPVLQRGTQKLTYGNGVMAPWNSNTPPTPVPQPAASKPKDGGANGIQNGKDGDGSAKPLPDARLWATWDYEQKRFHEPLSLRRGRIGGVQALNSVGPPGRGRSESRMS